MTRRAGSGSPFVGALDSANVYILLHEMGHSFGLDDFYDWTPTGVDGF